LHNIAFQTQPGEICSLTDVPSIIAVDEISHTIFPFSETDLEKCNPFQSKDLCYIPQFPTSFYPHMKCLETLFFSSSTKDIITHCNYKCQTTKTPVVQYIDHQRYAVTNVDSVTTNCNGTISTHPLDKPGSLFINLPCNCKAYHNDAMLIDSVYPCAEKWTSLQISHVVPSLFSRQTDLRSTRHNMVNTSVLNFTQFFVNDSLELSNIVKEVKALTFAQFRAKPITGIRNFVYNNHESISHGLIFFWLFVMTFIWVWPRIRIFCFGPSVMIRQMISPPIARDPPSAPIETVFDETSKMIDETPI